MRACLSRPCSPNVPLTLSRARACRLFDSASRSFVLTFRPGIDVLDQRAHPVSLASGHACVAHAPYDLAAPRIGDELRRDGGASRRQLVDDGHVQIGVVAHRERAWNGRRAHHELMRGVLPALRAFHAQCEPLVNAEPMLLVHDRKAEVAEAHLLLKERVRADGDSRAAGRNALQRCLPVPFLQSPGEPCHTDVECFQPRRELAVVLFGENLRRRHHGHLSVVLDRLKRRERRHDRLAAADIALEQSLHGIGLR